METKEEIKQLEEKIKKIKKAKAEKLKDKFQYIVGKCFHRSGTLWEKVTSISYVETNSYGYHAVFECISIYRDEDNIVINTQDYGDIDSEGIKYYIIPNENFEEVYMECVEVALKMIEV